MRKRVVGISLVVILLLASVPVSASQQIVEASADLSFSNYTATCYADIYAASGTDRITATMQLWRGAIKVGEWSDADYGDLYLSGTASVTRYRTYTLLVNYSINGVAQTPVSIDRYYG